MFGQNRFRAPDDLLDHVGGPNGPAVHRRCLRRATHGHYGNGPANPFLMARLATF